jgi:hypothetical protein
MTAARSYDISVEPLVASEDIELLDELVAEGVCTREQADAALARLEELMDGVLLGELTPEDAVELMGAFTLAQHESGCS